MKFFIPISILFSFTSYAINSSPESIVNCVDSLERAYFKNSSVDKIKRIPKLKHVKDNLKSKSTSDSKYIYFERDLPESEYTQRTVLSKEGQFLCIFTKDLRDSAKISHTILDKSLREKKESEEWFNTNSIKKLFKKKDNTTVACKPTRFDPNTWNELIRERIHIIPDLYKYDLEEKVKSGSFKYYKAGRLIPMNYTLVKKDSLNPKKSVMEICRKAEPSHYSHFFKASRRSQKIFETHLLEHLIRRSEDIPSNSTLE